MVTLSRLPSDVWFAILNKKGGIASCPCCGQAYLSKKKGTLVEWWLQEHDEDPEVTKICIGFNWV